jgi:hypothetical protein
MQLPPGELASGCVDHLVAWACSHKALATWLVFRLVFDFLDALFEFGDALAEGSRELRKAR